MMKPPLSITEVIRFANHDFVNHLHLVQMNLDLGLVDEAKAIIRNVSEKYQNLSQVNRLNLPRTVEWIQLCQWRFPALTLTIESNITQPVRMNIDKEVVQYLENTVHHVYEQLDPYTEQTLHLSIQVTAQQFELLFVLKGLWHASKFELKEQKILNVQMIEETSQSWICQLSVSQE